MVTPTKVLPILLVFLPYVQASTWLAKGPIYFEGEGKAPSQCTVDESYLRVDECVKATVSTMSLYAQIRATKMMGSADDYGCFDASTSAIRVALPLNIFNSELIWPNVTLRVGPFADISTDCQFSNFAIGMAAYPPAGGCGPVLSEDIMIAVRASPPTYLGRLMPIFRWQDLKEDTSMLIDDEKAFGDATGFALAIEMNTFAGNRTLGEAVGVVIQPTVKDCKLTFLTDTAGSPLTRLQVQAWSVIDGQLIV